MKIFIGFLKNNAFPLLLFLIETILFAVNYKAGTYFVGWDNLFPELNFSANIRRSFFGVWQEYRGLGLLDGMSFAANLPHYLFIYLLSFILPQNMLRYCFIFLMHFLGGWGMYLLLTKVISGYLSNKNFIRASGFVGALFYLFNLYTIQMFYTPYELFTIHFAFLPFLAIYLGDYLETGRRKPLFMFALFTFLSIPQAHVPTIFLVYILFVTVLLLFHIFKKKNEAIKRSLAIIFVIFAINAYWAIPYAYSAINNAKIIASAKINQMTSEDVYLNNKFRGKMADTAFLQGFMLDMVEMKKDGTFDYVMKQWRTQTEKAAFHFGAIMFLALALVGVIYSLIKKKKEIWPYLVLSFIAFFFLANDTFIIGSINEFLRGKFPIFAEIFRFSFTKFAILFVFCWSIFFFIGTNVLIKLIYDIRSSKKRKYYTCVLFLLSLVFVIFLYCFPAFRGNFLFDDIRTKIPEEYFKVADFFNSQPKNSRIASFPQSYYWSWRFYKWGSQGSGFLWYGVSQPIMDRAFDPWSNYNENYYWEISYALYSKDKKLLENVLEKYQINYLLVDENVVSPFSVKSLFFDELKTMLSSSEKVYFVMKVGSISIYGVNLNNPVKDYVYLSSDLPVVGLRYEWNNNDKAFSDNGNYIVEDKNTDKTIYYPFRSLFSGRRQEDLEFTVSERGDDLVFSKNLPEGLLGYSLKVPDGIFDELILINPNNLSEKKVLRPEVFYDGRKVEVIFPKVGGYFSKEINPYNDLGTPVVKNCNSFGKGSVGNRVVISGENKLLEVSALDAQNCSVSFWIPSLSHQYSYLITAESENIKGKSLLFWLENLDSRRADIESYLPKENKLVRSYFIQPPMESDGAGYSLHFDNTSIGREESVNRIGKVTVNMIPYNFLTSLQLIKSNGLGGVVGATKGIEVNHPNPSLYEVDGGQLGETNAGNFTLVLSQAFDKGWKAYVVSKNTSSFFAPVLGKEIKDHVLVNNWENGFLLRPDFIGTTEGQGRNVNDYKIIIVFWPQYLEYLGLFLLITGVIGCVIYGIKGRRKEGKRLTNGRKFGTIRQKIKEGK